MSAALGAPEFVPSSRDTSPCVAVQIGAIPILLQPSEPEFCGLLEERYAGFLNPLADPQGGFLVHAASAIRGGVAYLFAGVSGAGKTNMARRAPPDAVVLTDEISYVRRIGTGYRAYGTPFAGELARSGANTSTSIHALYLLEQGLHNRVERVEPADAA
jgi:hypothetical protein